ncbi:hypothetical protein HK405_009712 [Cladochytrium tenue]|nr:hypothetical protein HK405_009712 [Cladochytrium tenue]
MDTVHLSFRPGSVDRGKLYSLLRKHAGFRVIGLYNNFVFAAFVSHAHAVECLKWCRTLPTGIASELAKQSYTVPYPQPEDDPANLGIVDTIHLTHLPPNYTQDEMRSMCCWLDGFESMQFHGKYLYVRFAHASQAAEAREILRQETNLVVTFSHAKRAPPPGATVPIVLPDDLGGLTGAGLPGPAGTAALLLPAHRLDDPAYALRLLQRHHHGQPRYYSGGNGGGEGSSGLMLHPTLPNKLPASLQFPKPQPQHHQQQHPYTVTATSMAGSSALHGLSLLQPYQQQQQQPPMLFLPPQSRTAHLSVPPHHSSHAFTSTGGVPTTTIGVLPRLNSRPVSPLLRSSSPCSSTDSLPAVTADDGLLFDCSAVAAAAASTGSSVSPRHHAYSPDLLLGGFYVPASRIGAARAAEPLLPAARAALQPPPPPPATAAAASAAYRVAEYIDEALVPAMKWEWSMMPTCGSGDGEAAVPSTAGTAAAAPLPRPPALALLPPSPLLAAAQPATPVLWPALSAARHTLPPASSVTVGANGGLLDALAKAGPYPRALSWSSPPSSPATEGAAAVEEAAGGDGPDRGDAGSPGYDDARRSFLPKETANPSTWQQQQQKEEYAAWGHHGSDAEAAKPEVTAAEKVAKAATTTARDTALRLGLYQAPCGSDYPSLFSYSIGPGAQQPAASAPGAGSGVGDRAGGTSLALVL